MNDFAPRNLRTFARITCGILLGLTLAVEPIHAASTNKATGRSGMVASGEISASRVGIQILRQGGNAVDAGVAIALALAVTRPDAGNLAGGGFMMVHLHSGSNAAIDFRETAPALASRTMYLDRSGRIIPRASTLGYRAIGTPGTVAGLALAERRYGRLSWKQVIEPARQLASRGFAVPPIVAEVLTDPDVKANLQAFQESRKEFLPEGHPWQAGEWVKRPGLAAVLTRLEQYGAEDFYRGQIARKIDRDMRVHGGLVRLSDLKSYKALIRRPVVGTYRGYTIVSMPPPSSGGTTLIEMLNILERYQLGPLGARSPQAIHLMVEAMRRAFADRSVFLGDPDFVRVPVARLISKAYAAERSRTILLDKATPAGEVGPGNAAAGEKPETTHFSVVDRAGNAVSCTYTLNGAFGSGATVPGTGIVLNNEMDDFTSQPGVPNMFGLIQGEANAIAPGKRPLSSMCPTFVLQGKRLFLVTGSPGGPTIINTVLQIITNLIDFHESLSAAVSAPRFHHQWKPDRIRMERAGFSEEVRRALEQMGYALDERDPMGDAQTILIDTSGLRTAVSDTRGSGASLAE